MNFERNRKLPFLNFCFLPFPFVRLLLFSIFFFSFFFFFFLFRKTHFYFTMQFFSLLYRDQSKKNKHWERISKLSKSAIDTVPFYCGYFLPGFAELSSLYPFTFLLLVIPFANQERQKSEYNITYLRDLLIGVRLKGSYPLIPALSHKYRSPQN